MAIKFPLKSVLFLSTIVLFSNPVFAHWSLDNDASVLSFVTVKAEHVAEAHTFDVLTGSIGDSGNIEISIELASVNTMIPIRNERMQAMLLETNLFPEATISAQVDIDSLAMLAPGESLQQNIDIDLSLHGSSLQLNTELMITRTSEGLIASTLKPIIVTADSLGLVAGIEKLREVAGLPSISRSVPVSFTVTFIQGH